jgi:ribose-phosphate pyrophosphokinase
MSIRIQTSTNQTVAATFLQFPGGERHVQVEAPKDLGLVQTINLRANLNSSNDIMDYLLLENALFKLKPDLKIDLELPYLPYARQDRVCSTGQAFSLELMAKLLLLNPKNSIKVWDCHSQVGLNLTGAINIAPEKIIANSPQLLNELNHENAVLIVPDKGAIKRCSEIANAIGIKQMITCEKVRNPATGKISHTTVLADDLTGKTAIITDDICDGGMTFIGIANALKKVNTKRILLYVTHGIFSKGINVFDGLIDHIYTTDSFPQTSNEKLTVINL